MLPLFSSQQDLANEEASLDQDIGDLIKFRNDLGQVIKMKKDMLRIVKDIQVVKKDLQHRQIKPVFPPTQS